MLNSAFSDPALLRFWRAAYRRFERPLPGGVGFAVPEFPSPLLSPNFALTPPAEFLRRNPGISHFNELLALGYGQRDPAPPGYRLEKQFYFCSRRLVDPPAPLAAGVKSVALAEAIENPAYWALLGAGFPKDIGFLHALLPFLASLEAKFQTVFLQDLGAITVGVAGGVALALNAVVAPHARGEGHSATLASLAETAARLLGADEAFFWTEHAFLSRHAEAVGHYRIYGRVLPALATSTPMAI